MASGQRYTKTEETKKKTIVVFCNPQNLHLSVLKQRKQGYVLQKTPIPPTGASPERRPLDVGVVIIIVQHQNTFLKERRRR